MNPNSKTDLLIQKTKSMLIEKKADVDTLDLRNIEMPFCDGRKLDDYPVHLKDLYRQIQTFDAVIIGMPVYQYTVPGPLKNFLDIVSHALKNKIIGVLSMAGSSMSYLAAADLIKMLNYEVQVVAVQPHVFAHYGDFENHQIKNPKIVEKIQQLVSNIINLLGGK